MFVAIFVVVGIVALVLFYKDYKTIEKLTKEIGELSADNELLQIDLEGQKLFTKVYESFLESCHVREINLTEELESLQNKNVKKKEVKNTKSKNKKLA